MADPTTPRGGRWWVVMAAVLVPAVVATVGLAASFAEGARQCSETRVRDYDPAAEESLTEQAALDRWRGMAIAEAAAKEGAAGPSDPYPGFQTDVARAYARGYQSLERVETPEPAIQPGRQVAVYRSAEDGDVVSEVVLENNDGLGWQVVRTTVVLPKTVCDRSVPRP